MTESTFIFIILLFVFTLCFLTFTFSQKFSRPHQCFGVTLNENYQKNPSILNITRQFFRYSTFIFIFSLLLALIGYALLSEDTFGLAIPFLIILTMIGYFAVYIITHNKVKAFKKNLKEKPIVPTKMVVDTTFIQEKLRLKNIFKILFSAPLLFNLSISLYTFYRYPSVPDLIPMHWNFMGQIDAWTPKSFFTLLMPSIFSVFLVIMLLFTVTSLFNARGKLNPKKLEGSKKELLIYLKCQAFSIYLLTLSISLMFASIAFATFTASAMSKPIMLIFGALLLAGVLLMLYGTFKYNRKRSPKTSEEEDFSYAPEDDDNYWVWGSFYNNPNDPSLFVEKRYGVGWTVNIGNKKGKWLLAFLTLFVLLSLSLPLIL
ncbi:hypothetical protein CS063_07880 [Sporanaerobium hydrogeniformans]|uniref:Uncharacterized protein n=1 Tax=Sporanaerobium hydrogeniformans TaxID=3072179 RepID=A0AC61DDM5_9FIRM|nr:DUF5808 domain-containing protein [Sporanaerobium hydrogeniformans]PHV70930.1 hypothetical protein CS063_07880 [Sporanaerobium hydrogeniformans]